MQHAGAMVEVLANSIPLHIKVLYNRNAEWLEKREHVDFYNLLCEYKDVFSAGPHDLGHTDLVQHHINTGPTAPMRQQSRRLPLTRMEEADKAIQEILEQNIIETFASPWSSPIIVLSWKKNCDTRFCVDYCRLNAATHAQGFIPFASYWRHYWCTLQSTMVLLARFEEWVLASPVRWRL